MTVSANPLVDLTTVADATAWLSAQKVELPSSDTLQQIITAASYSIQGWLGRRVVPQSYTQTFDGRGTDRLAVPNCPITAVSSLTIDGVSIPAATSAVAYGYVFSTAQDPPASPWILLRGCRFNRGVANVTVSYTAGFNPLPDPMMQACREAMTALAQVSAREPGLIMEKVGGLEQRYVSPVDPNTVALNKFILTPTITLALAPYRRVVPVG